MLKREKAKQRERLTRRRKVGPLVQESGNVEPGVAQFGY